MCFSSLWSAWAWSPRETVHLMSPATRKERYSRSGIRVCNTSSTCWSCRVSESYYGIYILYILYIYIYIYIFFFECRRTPDRRVPLFLFSLQRDGVARVLVARLFLALLRSSRRSLPISVAIGGMEDEEPRPVWHMLCVGSVSATVRVVCSPLVCIVRHVT